MPIKYEGTHPNLSSEFQRIADISSVVLSLSKKPGINVCLIFMDELSLVVLNDSNIKDINDLKGKKVGTELCFLLLLKDLFV